jgi:hypothetical protein
MRKLRTLMVLFAVATGPLVAPGTAHAEADGCAFTVCLKLVGIPASWHAHAWSPDPSTDGSSHPMGGKIRITGPGGVRVDGPVGYPAPDAYAGGHGAGGVCAEVIEVTDGKEYPVQEWQCFTVHAR